MNIKKANDSIPNKVRDTLLELRGRRQYILEESDCLGRGRLRQKNLELKAQIEILERILRTTEIE